MFQKILLSKVFMHKRVGVRVRIRGWASRFCLKFHVSQCRKTSCGKFLVWKKHLWVTRDGGGCNGLVENFVSQDRTE